MPPLYALTAQTVGDVRRLISHGDRGRGAGGRRTASRGVTWVKVTGTPDDDGWHPAVVSIDDSGTWVDKTAEVLVAAADGSDLAVGKRYECTRTGDEAVTGKARFRTGDGDCKEGADWNTAGGSPSVGYEQSRLVADVTDELVVTNTVTRIPGGSGLVMIDAGAEAFLLGAYAQWNSTTEIMAALCICDAAGTPGDVLAVMVIAKCKLLPAPVILESTTGTGFGPVQFWVENTFAVMGSTIGSHSDTDGEGILTGDVSYSGYLAGHCVGQGRRLLSYDFGDDDARLVWKLFATVGATSALVSGTLTAANIGRGGTYILWRQACGMMAPESPP